MARHFHFLILAILALCAGVNPFGVTASAVDGKEKSSSAIYNEDQFEAMALKLRQQAIESTRVPRVETKAPSFSLGQGFNRYPWKRDIFTTVFWIGERPTAHNPVPNNKSTWDAHWARNFGGYDNPHPSARQHFVPKGFIPRQNPFYCALPYNDVTRGSTKSEARRIIPWFKDVFVKPGQSVLKGRWVAIHHAGRTCFAQWEDCGPFRTDHGSYVFGPERPRPNLNHGAGLDISPAVRDYLGLDKNQMCDWKFVEASVVPDGPWKNYGNNNTFFLLRQGKDLKIYDPNNRYHSPSGSTSWVKANPISSPFHLKT